MNLNGATLTDTRFATVLEHFAKYIIHRNLTLTGPHAGDRDSSYTVDVLHSSPNSPHNYNAAADFHAEGMSDAAVAAAAASSHMFHGVELSLGMLDAKGNPIRGRGPHVHVDAGGLVNRCVNADQAATLRFDETN